MANRVVVFSGVTPDEIIERLEQIELTQKEYNEPDK